MISTHRMLREKATLTLLAWLAVGVSVRAESELVFPHVVDGDGIGMEIQFTNPGEQTETGLLSFRSADGQSESFWFGSVLRDSVAVSVPAGGVWSLRSDRRGSLKVGYAVFTPDRTDSQLSGLLIFTVGQNSQLSVPASPGRMQGHFLVERAAQLRTGIAVAHSGTDDLTVMLALRDENGEEVARNLLQLDASTKRAFFLSEQFPGLEGADFRGSLHLRADRPFHFLGLRQHENGSVAGLAGGDTAFPNAGSQLLFAVDSGINPREGSLPIDVLKHSTVKELLGLDRPTRDTVVRLHNTHPEAAVTLLVRILNDRCEDILRFLMVLECDQEVMLQPLDFQIPGSDLRTSQLLFGGVEQPGPAPVSAHDFGDGRFLVEVQAVGAAPGKASQAEILFPNELAPIGSCNVTPLNSGSSSGSLDNLWICNARPMSFNYLVGSIEKQIVVDDVNQVCSGRMVQANRLLERASFFLAALDADSDGCLQPGPQPSCRLRRLMNNLTGTDCADSDIGVVIAIRSSDPTFILKR